MQITGAVPIALVGRFTSSCAHATSLQLRTVSSALQAEQDRGLERQATAADAWCAARGLQIDNGLSDAGISAFKGDNVAKGALGKFLAMPLSCSSKQLTGSAGKEHSTACRMCCLA